MAQKKRREEQATVLYPPDERHKVRMRSVLWAFLLGLGWISIGLVSLYLSPEWDFSAEDQYHLGEVIIPKPRGTIFDCNQNILAMDRDASSLSADPMRIVQPDQTAQILSEKLGLDESQVYERLTRRRADGAPMRFVWIKRWLTPEECGVLGDVKKIAEGLCIESEPVRYYPQDALAAHILGFVNRERIGSEGVEMLFENKLMTTPERRVAWKDTSSSRSPILLPSFTKEYEPASGGDDVYLTLDSRIQDRLERELDAALVRCKAESAMGLLMDPKTGAILALACRPAFNPNLYMDAQDELRKNRAVLDVFEPGSSFKIVTASAALETGVIKPSSPINCEGGVFYPYAGRRITDTHKLGVAPFSDCFAESSNIAMIKLAALIGGKSLDDYIQRFRFGQKTSRDFPIESAGIYRPLGKWSRASIVSLPMGQEVAVTMPQLARAYSAIANGGYLVEPHVVDRAVSRDGETTYQFESGLPQRIIHEDTARIMRELCHEVVTKGTGVYANIDEYRVCGKTGTAQIAKLDGSGYYKDQYNTVFAGFAPLADPRICGVIVVRSPMIRMHYGGYVCGPIFRKVVREALVLLNCPVDPVQVEVKIPIDYLGGPAEEEAPEDDADTILARLDTGQDAFPASDLLAPLDELKLTLPVLDIPTDGPVMPSFRGMTKHQAGEKANELGIKWTARGSGWVVYQDPPVGTPLAEVNVCRLVFSNNRGESETPQNG